MVGEISIFGRVVTLRALFWVIVMAGAFTTAAMLGGPASLCTAVVAGAAGALSQRD
jgi:hypothetical protein